MHAERTATALGGAVLQLHGFGVAFGERVVLSAVDLHIAERQTLVLLGPSGSGKSTLLRTLAGFNDASPALRTWGRAAYLGCALDDAERPALVVQSARLLLSSVLSNIVQGFPGRARLTLPQQRELALRLVQRAGLHELIAQFDAPAAELPLALQRHLALLRLAAAGPQLICLDEPTTGLSDADAQRLLAHIRAEGQRHALLVVLHNQVHARALGGTVALLAGGVIQESAPSAEFFAAPRSSAGRAFVTTGSCAVASPGADPATLDPQAEAPAALPPEAHGYVSDAFGPRGFLWLKKGRLAGTPRPGIVHDLDYDLKALVRVGVTTLVSLTCTPPDSAAYAAAGIANLWFPIPDMTAPSLEQAQDICRQIEQLLAQGAVVAIHCRAGLGRTGTLLACCLIWEGLPALDALDAVRRIEPRWVQSDVQLRFLEEFAFALANGSAPPHADNSVALHPTIKN